ncbi:helix-turn-helix domain-containing protein [Streptomyces noursei]
MALEHEATVQSPATKPPSAPGKTARFKRPLGRPAKPVANRDRAVGRLAERLRAERVRKGLTYAELAKRTAYHASTLERADSGTQIPTLAVALSYAQACGLGGGEVRQLWREARREERRRTRGDWVGRAPRPELIRNLADLSAALVEIYEATGLLSVRELEARAEVWARRTGNRSLSRSSAHRIITRQVVPRADGQLVPFLMACEVPEHKWPTWVEACNRAWQRKVESDGPYLYELKTQFHEREAASKMRAAGFIPMERYANFGKPWTVRCQLCSSVQRVRLAYVLDASHKCVICGSSTDSESTGT